MGKKERTKGAAYEREVARDLRPIDPDACRNLDQYQKESGRDLSNTQPVCYQLKNYKKITMGVIETALSEAMNATDDEYIYPAAITRSDRKRSLITMFLDDYVEMRCKLEDGEL